MALRLRSASQKFRKSVLCPRSAPSTKRFHTRRRAECLLWVISGGGGELGLRSGLPLTADLAAAEELFGWSRQRTSGEVHQNREVNRGTADGELRFVPVNHREIVMRSIALALVILLTETSLSFAQGHMGTPQEQQACRRDAQRFCRQQLGDDGAVQQCLQQNRTRLSKSCQKVFASHGM